MPKQKMTTQIQMRLVEYPSSKVSDPSEVPRILTKLIFPIFQEVKLNLRELDNIVLARTSNNSVRAVFSLVKVHILLDLRLYYAIRASASVRLPKHRFELKGPILGLKHPGNQCTWTLRHNFCCRGPILIPRPVLESPA